MKNEMMSLRISPELRKQLQKIACNQNRTMSNLIKTVLLEYVNNNEGEIS